MGMKELEISDDLLLECVNAAVKGANIAEEEKFTTDKSKKDDNTFVTEADKRAEKKIREELNENTDYSIVGEEHGGNLDSDSYWLVDPIDGTQNYAYKQPLYGTAVALIEDDNPVLGCFYMPELEYLFYAKEDNGAYLNNDKIHVSELEDLTESYITLTGYNIPQNMTPILENINRWGQSFSCALQSECWVANGWNDVCVAGKLHPWDLGTGTIMVREAGGVVKTLDGDDKWSSIKNGGTIMGNKNLVDLIIEELPEEIKNDILTGQFQK